MAALRLAAIISALILAVVAPSAPRAEEAPTVKVAVLKFGTVNWLLNTVQHYGLDKKHSVTLEVLPLAGGAATAVAFQSGDADMFVTDWFWTMRKRADETALKFWPYSRSLGALVASKPMTLCDLPGKTVGVVGGPNDKSWLLMQALAEQECGIDLAAETETLSGAPPLMSRQLQDGAVEAVSTYWHFVAKLEANGATPIMRVTDALAKLGIDPAPPMIGFVWAPDRTDDAAANRLMQAITEAGGVLAKDDAAWDRLRPLMRAKTDAEFTALRDAYRAGIPGPWGAAETKSAMQLYALMGQRGGKVFTTKAGPFAPSIFPAP